MFDPEYCQKLNFNSDIVYYRMMVKRLSLFKNSSIFFTFCYVSKNTYINQYVADTCVAVVCTHFPYSRYSDPFPYLRGRKLAVKIIFSLKKC